MKKIFDSREKWNISSNRFILFLSLLFLPTVGHLFADGLLYIGNEGDNQILSYNPFNNELTNLNPTGQSLTHISSFATSADRKNIYISSGSIPDIISVYNIDSNTVTNLNAPDGGLSYRNFIRIVLGADPDTLYVLNYSNPGALLLYNIDANTMTNLNPSGVGLGYPTNFILSADKTILYVFNSFPAQLLSYNIATNTITNLNPTGGYLIEFITGCALSGDGKIIYISNASINKLLAYNIETNTLTNLNPTGADLSTLSGIVLSPDEENLYIATGYSNELLLYNIGNNSVINLAPTGASLSLPLAVVSTFPPISPPTYLKGQQYKNDFGLQYELYNALHWSASLGVVEGYYVYRNGVRIATLGSSTLQYQDHNQPQGVTTVYSVTAFEGSSESTAISININ